METLAHSSAFPVAQGDPVLGGAYRHAESVTGAPLAVASEKT